MKKIYIAVVLMLNLQSIIYSAQKSKYDVDHKRQGMINDAVKNFPYLTQGFDFLHNQHLVDTTFHDFLERNISHDEYEHEDINFDLAIIKAEDIIANNMKDRFLQTLDIAMTKFKKFNQFDDPIFWYVMEYKDTTMHDMVRLWLYEWRYNGQTPLHIAANSGHTEIARILIAKDINISSQDGYGQTPLHFATCNNHTEIARMLIAKGINISSQDGHGQTPLYWATYHNNKKIVRMLILAHADLTNPDRLGKTPLDLAVSRYNIEIAYMLLIARINTNFVLFDFEKIRDVIVILSGIVSIIIISNHIVDNIDVDNDQIMFHSMVIMSTILHVSIKFNACLR